MLLESSPSADLKIEKDVLAMVSGPMAQMYRVIPIEFDGDDADGRDVRPAEPERAGRAAHVPRPHIRVLVATESSINAALERYYGENTESVESIVESLEDDDELAAAAAALEAEGPIDLTSVEALADSAPVRKLLNMVLLMAIKDHASDLHFEPFEDEFRIRIKADGVLYEMVPPPRHLAFAITTRIKVMANLDIAERRLPQDGRIELTVGGHPVDLRVSVLPTMFGESVVMRVLDRSGGVARLTNVGMNDETMAEVPQVDHQAERHLPGDRPDRLGQDHHALLGAVGAQHDRGQADHDRGPGRVRHRRHRAGADRRRRSATRSPQCLRAILRQDPDKVLVGEIRDLETAEIAVQASLTGHLVFSTLHTNDAPSTITRLKDMGVPTFLITATVEAILAQRLVRRICKNCREEYTPSSEVLDDLELTADDIKGKRFYRGGGCEVCNNTGYKGRVGLFELMIMTNDAARPDHAELPDRRAARRWPRSRGW